MFQEAVAGFGNWLKNVWAILLVVGLTFWIFGDWSHFGLAIIGIATVALVATIAMGVVGSKKGWGLLPIDVAASYERACLDPRGAAIVFVGILAFVAFIIFMGCKVANAGTIPETAKPLLPVLSHAIKNQWPQSPCSHYLAAQVEQESGWKLKAHLHTSREDGYGLVQITVTPRFNNFLTAIAMKPLKGWDWKKDPYNPEDQLTFLVLQQKANFAEFRPYIVNDDERSKVMSVAYNAGPGRVLSRIKFAKIQKLPADRWTGGLENAHGPGENSILYDRPLWKAVNEYPSVITARSVKYIGHV